MCKYFQWVVFGDEEVQLKHTFTCTLTIDTKLRAFQYKYVLKILITLFFIYIVLFHPDFVSFMTRDLLSNMFWECHIIQAFWRNVKCFLEYFYINIE